ncbi:MAG: hypoxanthine phosphoribosyltransferase [Schleiferiaceae bacterium]|jgi:hypoxanthine phosphoribosyltransferase|nr:hypoxanthine phosphoribosyltransferase [Schleiferiaceae bacterium]
MGMSKDEITISELRFKPFLSESRILAEISNLSDVIDSHYRDQNPIFLCVLNGSFTFTSEILRHLDFPYETAFVIVKSYDGTTSSNTIKEFIGLTSSVKDRHVIICEDIVESGLTTNYLIGKLKDQEPKSIMIATLLFKPNQLKYSDLPIKYVGFEISDEFVVGFGLDYNEKGRNLRSIYQKVD